MEIGVLFDSYDAVAQRLAEQFELQGFVTALNEPYSGLKGMMTVARRHGTAHGVIYLELELRQDLIDNRDKGSRRRSKGAQGAPRTSNPRTAPVRVRPRIPQSCANVIFLSPPTPGRNRRNGGLRREQPVRPRRLPIIGITAADSRPKTTPCLIPARVIAGQKMQKTSNAHCEERHVVGHETELCSHRWIPPGVATEDRNPTPVQSAQPGETFEKRRLARTVGTHQSDHLSRAEAPSHRR